MPGARLGWAALCCAGLCCAVLCCAGLGNDAVVAAHLHIYCMPVATMPHVLSPLLFVMRHIATPVCCRLVLQLHFAVMVGNCKQSHQLPCQVLPLCTLCCRASTGLLCCRDCHYSCSSLAETLLVSNDGQVVHASLKISCLVCRPAGNHAVHALLRVFMLWLQVKN